MKQEVDNIVLCCQRTTEPLLQITCTQIRTHGC